MTTQKLFFKQYFITGIIFIFTSCIQNPEAKLQNERIKDLQEKNVYLFERLKQQEQKIETIEDKILKLELNKTKKSKVKYVSKNHRTINDTMYVRLVQNEK